MAPPDATITVMTGKQTGGRCLSTKFWPEFISKRRDLQYFERFPRTVSCSSRSLFCFGLHSFPQRGGACPRDRKSTRLNSSHLVISYAVFCLKKKKKKNNIVFI